MFCVWTQHSFVLWHSPAPKFAFVALTLSFWDFYRLRQSQWLAWFLLKYDLITWKSVWYLASNPYSFYHISHVYLFLNSTSFAEYWLYWMYWTFALHFVADYFLESMIIRTNPHQSLLLQSSSSSSFRRNSSAKSHFRVPDSANDAFWNLFPASSWQLWHRIYIHHKHFAVAPTPACSFDYAYSTHSSLCFW